MDCARKLVKAGIKRDALWPSGEIMCEAGTARVAGRFAMKNEREITREPVSIEAGEDDVLEVAIILGAVAAGAGG